MYPGTVLPRSLPKRVVLVRAACHQEICKLFKGPNRFFPPLSFFFFSNDLTVLHQTPMVKKDTPDRKLMFVISAFIFGYHRDRLTLLLKLEVFSCCNNNRLKDQKNRFQICIWRNMQCFYKDSRMQNRRSTILMADSNVSMHSRHCAIMNI